MDRETDSVRDFTVKVIFSDGTQISVDCDDFVVIDNSHYCAVRDGLRIMTFPFCSVKYTVTICNRSAEEYR